MKLPLHNKKIILLTGIIFSLLVAVCGFLFLVNNPFSMGSDFSIENLRTCHLENPIGIDEETPVFSWQMKGEEQGLCQSAYRIVVSDSAKNLKEGIYLWDTGKTASGLSVGIPYAGSSLAPKTRYFWQVTVWNQDDKPCTSAEEAFFETGLMGQGMGNAKWISAPSQEADNHFDDREYIYSIHYDMELSNTSAAFIFGAERGRYGDMYLCRITQSEDSAYFELLKMSGGGFPDDAEVENAADISSCISENPDLFSVDLSVDHEMISVAINGTPIGKFSIESTPVGAVGYYKSRGTSYAYLDNLLVLDADGGEIYRDDFENDDTIFTPYYAVTEEGRLKIGSGLLLTKNYEEPAPIFYREFILQDKEIEDARIYMTALGSYQLSLNGQSVSDDYFAPGKSVYNQELTYMTYDVTSMMNSGESNTFSATLLHGWYDRAVGYPGIWNPWGETNALLGMLEIRYLDGSVDTIVTDEGFLCFTDGPVRMDDIYQGEYYDASKEPVITEGLSSPRDGWQKAETNAVDDVYSSLPLRGNECEPIRCVDQLTPISVSEPEENVFVYDFGQNFAGTCRIKVTGEAGQILTLRYGEALNEANMINSDDTPGTIWTENLLTAEATDYYVLSGASAGETYEPEFTYHGFRYLQITGLTEALPTEDVLGIVLSSDLTQTGSFTCSDELLNQFYQNTIWSQRSNFMDNPTDCSQRDERHGWAGDAQIYSLTASYHMDTYSFYRKYLRELTLLQTDGGSFPDMAPRNFGTGWDGRGGAATNNCWGDAAVVITWNLYTQYGDKTIIEENYDALGKWIEVLISTSDNFIRNWGGYGDHLSTESTPADVSDTAWCAHSAELLAKMATVLGRTEDAEYYQQTYEKFKEAWQNAYVNPDGTTSCDTQTSYALGLSFDLFPAELETAAVERLNTLAEYSGYHIHTGFSGIGCLLPALSENGLSETAYRMLLQRDYPSLLYPVSHGATTTYELLSGYTENEDGTYQLYGSLNHYAFGTPAGWLYSNVLGIKSDENDPGYHHILLKPEMIGGLTYANGSYDSIYGTISVAWEWTGDTCNLSVTIPPNTTATLTLPDSLEGEKIYELVSGSYDFTVK